MSEKITPPSNPSSASPDAVGSNLTSIINTTIKYLSFIIIVIAVGLFFKYDAAQLKSIGQTVFLWGSIYAAGVGTPFAVRKALDYTRSLVKG